MKNENLVHQTSGPETNYHCKKVQKTDIPLWSFSPFSCSAEKLMHKMCFMDLQWFYPSFCKGLTCLLKEFPTLVISCLFTVLDFAIRFITMAFKSMVVIQHRKVIPFRRRVSLLFKQITVP